MATCCRAQPVLSEVHHLSRNASLVRSTHFARISRARVSQAAANVLQIRPRVNGALRLKTVNVALLVPCQQKGVPADALPRKPAIQTNCLPQPTQKRKIVFHTLVGGSAFYEKSTEGKGTMLQLKCFFAFLPALLFVDSTK